MKKGKHLNPLIALIIMILLYAFASTLERRNIAEDKQAQIDCRVQDTEINYLTDYSNE